MKMLFAALLAAANAIALPAAAQSTDEVHSRIEALHGDADGFDKTFEQLTQPMGSGDAETVARLGSYPLRVEANSEVYDVLEAQDLVENFDRLVMSETQARVANQDYADLFVNSDGVMFADGALWMTLICEDDSCASSSWAITAINN